MENEKELKTISIVEDQADLAQMYADRLIEEGYKVAMAADGEQGLLSLNTQVPDLILLDIMMPKKDGFEVLDLLRKIPQTSKTPVIILTAFPSSENADKAHNLGALDLFNKAATMPKEIVSAVNKALFPGA